MTSLYGFTHLLVGVTLITACGESDDHEDTGTPSGAVCPSDSPTDYENFGRAFMERYCTKCHSSALKGDARNGAPLAHDFDTYEGVLAVAKHIDRVAAAGPDATNTEMPPGDAMPVPSLEERQRLAQWLACVK